MSERMQVTAHHWRDWPLVSGEWQRIHEQSRSSLFLRSEWVETWIEVFGQKLQPVILLFRVGDVAVGACLITARTSWRWCVPLRRVHLNCAGEAERDDTCIEYNRLMCLPGCEFDVHRALADYLGSRTWDELVLSGMEEQEAIEELYEVSAKVRASQKASWYVDLAHLRSTGAPYASTLSANTRQQIQRSIRLYEEAHGPLAIRMAGSGAEACSYLNELAELHQKRWLERNRPGVFASEVFFDFHRRLISRLQPRGAAHVLRVTAGEQVIGLLYNFLSAGRVYFYQSGFAYQQDARVKPGLVTHFLAIDHYLTSCPGVMEYDFLAGDAQYKKSLAKRQRPLTWTVVQRPTLQAKAVETLKSLGRKLRR